MRICICLSLICCLFLAVGKTQANESEKFRFSGLSIQDGLSQSTVYSISQDHKGFLWVATADGLNKYDGYNFTVYQHLKDDTTSIQSNLIRALLFDDDHRLWVGTGSGISCYDDRKNTFTNYILNTQVNHICQVRANELWLATSTGFFKFDMKAKTTTPLSFEGKPMSSSQVIVKYKDLVLLGSNTGLFMSPLGEEKIVRYGNDLQGKNVMDIRPNNKGIWVATEGNGLFFLNDNGTVRQYRHNSNDKQSLSSDYVRCLCFDLQNRLWVGTFSGLSIYNESNDTFDTYYSNEIEKTAISHNSVRSLFHDHQGAMWIGTYYGGLNYYHPLQNRFGRIRHLPFANSLNDNVVSCMVEGRPGELWIGTNDNGVNIYDMKKQTFSYHTAQDKPQIIHSNNVKSILYVDDVVYIGTHSGGMSVLRRKTGVVECYNTKNSALFSNNVYSFTQAPDGKIWVGTLLGLMIFDPVSRTLEPFHYNNKQPLANQSIFSLLTDSKNRIWIGTSSELFVYSFRNDELSHYPVTTTTGLSDSQINCIKEDSKHRIWIGTRNGLNLIDENASSFTLFTTENGLPNNTVFGILQDSFDRLWISTNKGLACFIPETEHFRIYTLTDGIQNDQFNMYAYCKLLTGEMYFGGINGITYFYPERLVDNPFTPNVIITQLNLFNKPVSPGDATGILETDISKTSHIQLSAYQSSFGLTFTVPNFLSAQHNTFAYKLEPFEKEWSYTSDIRTVSYSFLPAGNYVFSVKAANSDGKWSNNATILHIKVLPYWWNTVWARTGFIALFLFVVFLFFRFTYHRQVLKSQLALERMEKEKIEEVNQMKLRFFINISHEFRTPLSLIVSPLQEMMGRITDKWTREQLKIVQRNTNKLLYLVSQLMDYRRAELGVFELKTIAGDPIAQVEESMAMFERLVKQKAIDFIMENNLNNNTVRYDPHYFGLILNNLLSNAFKFTAERGRIIIGLSEKNGHFVLRVSDTGCGLTKEQQARIFDRFYQVNVNNTGTGIGLSLVKRLVELHHGKIDVYSEPDAGAEFCIYFPQDESLYSAQELAGQQSDMEKSLVDENRIALIQLPEENTDEALQNENKPLIMIVEDDVEVRDYLKTNFGDIANIEVAGNGEEALKIIKEQDIDIVLTDVMLPVMDGIKLCKAIKQNIRTCHIPVIMLTAKTNQQDQLEGLSAGADDYVSKPFNLSILRTKVQNMLKAKHRTLEHYSNTMDVDPERITFNVMDQELLEKAKSIVEKNLSNVEFSVDDFCKEMGMSRSTLHLKLKAITGESTIDLIRKIRFSHACQLLKEGRYSIAEISTMVGFNTPSYFTTSFKKYFDMLPTEYGKN